MCMSCVCVCCSIKRSLQINTRYITQELARHGHGQKGVAPEGEHLWRLELALPKLDVGGNGLDEGSHRGLVRHALREEVLL